jgi:SNF2 family DNA or RNA helicase
LTWDYELYDQFIRRVRRQGNKSKQVFVHHIIARGTIDDLAIMPALKSKAHGQNALFEALKSMVRK